MKKFILQQLFSLESIVKPEILAEAARAFLEVVKKGISASPTAVDDIILLPQIEKLEKLLGLVDENMELPEDK